MLRYDKRSKVKDWVDVMMCQSQNRSKSFFMWCQNRTIIIIYYFIVSHFSSSKSILTDFDFDILTTNQNLPRILVGG